MHVEALAYTRQTLGYARPDGLSDSLDKGAGAWPGDVEVPGGEWSLGSTPRDGFVFDNEKWAHALDIVPFRIAKAQFSASLRSSWPANLAPLLALLNELVKEDSQKLTASEKISLAQACDALRSALEA